MNALAQALTCPGTTTYCSAPGHPSGASARGVQLYEIDEETEDGHARGEERRPSGGERRRMLSGHRREVVGLSRRGRHESKVPELWEYFPRL